MRHSLYPHKHVQQSCTKLHKSNHRLFVEADHHVVLAATHWGSFKTTLIGSIQIQYYMYYMNELTDALM